MNPRNRNTAASGGGVGAPEPDERRHRAGFDEADPTGRQGDGLQQPGEGEGGEDLDPPELLGPDADGADAGEEQQELGEVVAHHPRRHLPPTGAQQTDAVVAEGEQRGGHVGSRRPAHPAGERRDDALSQRTDSDGEGLAAQHQRQDHDGDGERRQPEQGRDEEPGGGLALHEEEEQRQDRETELGQDVPDAGHQDRQGDGADPEAPRHLDAVGGSHPHRSTEGHHVRHGAPGEVDGQRLWVAQTGQRGGEHARVDDHAEHPQRREAEDLEPVELLDLAPDLGVVGAGDRGQHEGEDQADDGERERGLDHASPRGLAVELVLDDGPNVGDVVDPVDGAVEVRRAPRGPLDHPSLTTARPGGRRTGRWPGTRSGRHDA